MSKKEREWEKNCERKIMKNQNRRMRCRSQWNNESGRVTETEEENSM